MRVTVDVKAGSKNEKIQQIDDFHLKVWVKKRPIEGEANMAVINLLSDHFHVSKSFISIVSGFCAKRKVIEVEIDAQ